jgi:hypothetical protein
MAGSAEEYPITRPKIIIRPRMVWKRYPIIHPPRKTPVLLIIGSIQINYNRPLKGQPQDMIRFSSS